MKNVKTKAKVAKPVKKKQAKTACALQMYEDI
jgi:hypothetical protein